VDSPDPCIRGTRGGLALNHPRDARTESGRVAEKLDERVMGCLQSGRIDEALQLLMDSCGDDIYRFCRRMLGNPDDAEDARQQAFVKAYENLQKYRGMGSARGWLFAIARNVCWDLVKARKATGHVSDEGLEHHADPRPSVESSIVGNAIRDALDRCLAKLPDRTREVLLLRFAAGMTYPEICSAIGGKPAAHQVRVARAQPLLKKCLATLGFEP